MGKNIKTYRIIFNTLILFVAAVLCTYNMFAWYTGNDKTKLNDVGLNVVDNAKGNTFVLNGTSTGENNEIPLQPGEYSILNYEFKYTEEKELLIYLEENGLSFLENEETGNNEIIKFGRTLEDKNKVFNYFNTNDTSDSRFSQGSKMKVTEINYSSGNSSMNYLSDFLNDGNDSLKLEAFLDNANVYEALEVSALMLTDAEYTALGQNKNETIFQMSRGSSRSLTYYDSKTESTIDSERYIFKDTIPVSPSRETVVDGNTVTEYDPTHVLFIYYFNPNIYPSIYAVTNNGTTTYYNKESFDALNISDEYKKYIASSSIFYMYEHPVVKVDFKY